MTTQPKAKSNDYWAELEEMDRGSILHPFTVLKDFAEGRQRPRIVTGGKGVFIRDQDGRELLDAFARLTMIWRADGLAAVLAALDARFGGFVVIPVHGRAGEPAIRVLLRAGKGNRAPLQLLPGLLLNDEDGRPTAEAEDILRRGTPAWRCPRADYSAGLVPGRAGRHRQRRRQHDCSHQHGQQHDFHGQCSPGVCG